MSVMFLGFRYYSFNNMKPSENRKNLITKISRQKIYRYLSFATIGGGLLNIIVLYFFAENPDLANVMMLSFALFFFSLVIYLVQHLKLKEHTIDIICVGMIALLIPTITLHFIESGSVTVWAFPFILITAFIIFNRKILLIIVATSTIITQCVVWIFAPVVYVRLDGIDYCVRIGLFCIAICLIYYLNKLFVMRLNDTAYKVKLQELITQISTICVKTNQNNFEEDIVYLLKMSCEFFSLDRSYICMFDHGKNTFSTIQEYCREGIESGKDHFQKIAIDKSHLRMEKMLNNELFIVSDMQELPVFANEGMHELRIDRIKSQIMTPILSQEKVIGFWGFDSETGIINWQNDHINFIKIVANILGDTITRLDSEKEINFMAHFDHITKLPNRNLFTNYVYFNIIKLEFTDNILGIIFLDLDSFKTVNDTVGHGMGDELLFMVGQKLKSVLKKADIVSRFSSDEFLIMINDLTDEDEIVKITKDIMGLFYEPFMLKGQEFFMTASAGMALYPKDGEDAETLIMNADIAKFKAKDNGRNQYLLCTDEIKSEINKEKELINSLYRAMENDEIFLVYQPQVSLHTEKITGVESLLRWNHPKLGLISPSVIIPLAEQTGLINPIGEWVLESACAQNKAWQDMGIPPIQMAVNISASQFKNPQFIDQVEVILKKTGLNPEFLEIEITENIAILELNEIIGKLNGLKALGISIAIDDFGTEYSSLGRLKMLPIHRLKMDKQFVDGIGHNHKDQAIANAIIQLGKSLGLSVVAEGVEYEDQIAFLKTSECDLIQGYFYYKPLGVTELEKILISGCDLSNFNSTLN
ncbi:hypothetical protein AKG39_11230 [Acetobacterium bakii]|uniref:Diguanylate cyclase n=1 Tax=Acetobacterium bakii TaxID=52689 RepID=A0A0L6TZC8_9FIRM|nr:hypothetical protein AKG39_11230 [Acetobacterium bakii]